MLELGPGLRAVEVASPFDIHTYNIHWPAADVGGEPLAVRADAKRWNYVVSFPARSDAFRAPDTEQTAGWLTRVDAELVSGSAALAYVSGDLTQISGQVTLSHGRHDADLLIDDPGPLASVMARCGESPDIELRLGGFTCYRLIADDASVFCAPAGRVLRPVAHWSRFYGEPAAGLVERVRYLRFRQLTEPRFMEWLEGLEVLVVPGDQISQAVFVSGAYEPCTASVLRRVLREGDTFVDIGANIGLFTMLASRWVGRTGRVLALEPSQREFTRLRRHVDHNALPNVQAFRMAADSYNGHAMLHVADAYHSGQNTLDERFVHADVEEAHTESVPVVRVDDFVALHRVPKVQVIKIDVEGSEHHVVDGARQTIARDLPVLVLEVAGAALAAGHTGRTSIEAFLHSLGYRVAAIDAEEGTLRPVSDLTSPSENFIAASQTIFAALTHEASLTT